MVNKTEFSKQEFIVKSVFAEILPIDTIKRLSNCKACNQQTPPIIAQSFKKTRGECPDHI